MCIQNREHMSTIETAKYDNQQQHHQGKNQSSTNLGESEMSIMAEINMGVKAAAEGMEFTIIFFMRRSGKFSLYRLDEKNGNWITINQRNGA